MAQELVTIRIFRRPEEAHLARIALAPHGVTALVQNENYDSGDGPAWPADGVWLVVPAEHANRAIKLLDSDKATD